MASDAGSHRERQQRELEEIRRSFLEMGTKMGSLFEPAQRDDDADQPEAPTAAATADTPVRLGNRPTWMLAVLAAVCVLLGAALGYVLHRPAADTAQPGAVPAVATTGAPAPRVKVVVPTACLDTAKQADNVVDLVTRNIRDNRLTAAMQAYTLASQTCRKEASP